PAQGVRHRPDPERRLRRPDSRDPDRTRDPERGHAAGRLPGDAGEVPAEPRRLHVRREVRDPRLAGAGAGARARERGAGPEGGVATARKLLQARWHVEVVAWVAQVGGIRARCDVERVTREEVDRTPIRCPDEAVAPTMIAAVEAARKDGNSLGGLVECAVRGC